MLNKVLTLVRPLAILDLETTGLNADRDRVVQIAITMHYPDRDPISWASNIDPEMPIPNSDIHGVTDEDVKGMPKFRDFAPAFAQKMCNVDIGGHNVEYDIKFFRAEMKRAGIDWPWNGHVVDTLKICRIKIPHTLSNAYKRFVDPAGFENAHQAINDVAATEQVLFGQLNEFSDIPRTIPELAEFCTQRNPNAIDKDGKFVWINDEPCINFGKWRGTSLRKVDRGYLIWMINTPNFPDEAIVVAGNALKGIFPVRKTANPTDAD